MKIRLVDVALRAGVSTATVSRVLSDHPHVRPEVRGRVLNAIEELGYHPNRVARSLRGQKAAIIGVVISDIQNPFFTHLVRAVEDGAYAQQQAIFLCNTDEDVEKERFYLRLMVAEKVAGVVVCPASERGASLEPLLEAGIPVVTVDRRVYGVEVDSVLVDNVRATAAIIRHIIQDGHRRIAAILPSLTTTTGRQRHEGYLSAMQSAYLPIEEGLVRSGQPREVTGYRLTEEILELPSPPTAIFTGNNMLTVGAIRCLQERGIRIPEDMALVGFDDLEWMSILHPQLTVVAQPTYELGRTALRMLHQRIAEPNLPVRHIVLQARLIIRQSCARHDNGRGDLGRMVQA